MLIYVKPVSFFSIIVIFSSVTHLLPFSADETFSHFFTIAAIFNKAGIPFYSFIRLFAFLPLFSLVFNLFSLSSTLLFAFLALLSLFLTILMTLRVSFSLFIIVSFFFVISSFSMLAFDVDIL